MIFPKYEFDARVKIDREIDPPPASLFIALGFNQNKDSGKKHYRRYYPEELEKVAAVIPKLPFHEELILRGSKSGTGFFQFNKTDYSTKEIGQFKGLIKMFNKKEDDGYRLKLKRGDEVILQLIRDIYLKKHGEAMAFNFEKLDSFEGRGKFAQIMEDLGLGELDLGNYIVERSYEEQFSRMMLTRTKAIVRVYVIEGFNFASKDIGTASDPYLVLTCGKKTFNEKENYQLDQMNPTFFKCYEFDTEFPGASPLVIKAFDYDTFFGDELIGQTTIDLDDRFFSPEWQSINYKPVEYRQLHHPSSTGSQGVVKMWVEINQVGARDDAGKKDNTIWDIKPRPGTEYEVRAVVWDTKDLVCMDFEGTNDVFVKAYFQTGSVKETDTHYRCTTGEASFNYRLLFDLTAPTPSDNYMFTVQCWDRDFLAANDLIGEA